VNVSLWNYSKIYTTGQSTMGRRPCVEVSNTRRPFRDGFRRGLMCRYLKRRRCLLTYCDIPSDVFNIIKLPFTHREKIRGYYSRHYYKYCLDCNIKNKSVWFSGGIFCYEWKGFETHSTYLNYFVIWAWSCLWARMHAQRPKLLCNS
jgi:hypothetical protein